jgi:SAM-dependent methyltransferase
MPLMERGRTGIDDHGERRDATGRPESASAAQVTQAAVKAHFDAEARGRRLLPDPQTASGMGTDRKYRRAAALLAEPGVRDALDIGCNRGSIEHLFRTLYPGHADGVSIEGIDLSEEAIRQANELGLPRCTFRSYDGSGLPYGSGSFDLVIMVEVLEHVIDKERILGEVARVLRPGGAFFLTTPNPECWTLRAELAIRNMHAALTGKGMPDKDVFVSQKDLAGLLLSAGFRPARSGRMYAWPHFYLRYKRRCVLPPLPARALYHYQKACVRLFEGGRLPEWIERGFMWSLEALVRKPGVEGPSVVAV